ncbi:MAG: hypothetical protein KGQ61_12205 [Planctomycetes bacterium]|nr:hypothetical protein [Planctomycetota bacterium]
MGLHHGIAVAAGRMGREVARSVDGRPRAVIGRLSRSLVALLAAGALVADAVPGRAELIGLYQFDDAGDLGLDTSGMGNNATNVGATATTGFQGGAAYLNGSAYLRSPIDITVAALPRMTWGAWAKPDGTQPIKTVLAGDNGSFDRGINIDFRGGGGDSWSTFNGSGAVASGVAPSTTEWTFLAVVYDQSLSTLTFYVNDQSWLSSTNFGDSHTFFDIGHNPDFGEFFYGGVDNVFVYDQALTSSEIASIRTTGFPGAVPEVDPGAAGNVAAFVAGVLSLAYRRRHGR